MTDFNQSDRSLQIAIDGIDDALIIERFQTSAGIGILGAATARVSTDGEQLRGDQALGKSCQIKHFDHRGDREWHFLVMGLVDAPTRDSSTGVQLHLQPWLALSQHRSDSRVFQYLSAQDILTEVLSPYGFPVRFVLSGNSEPVEYRTQYEESDYNYVCRLLEREGWSYFFSQGETPHELVITDGARFAPAPNLDDVSCRTRGDTIGAKPALQRWHKRRQITPRAFSATDYFERTPSQRISETTADSQPYSVDLSLYTSEEALLSPDQASRSTRYNAERAVWQRCLHHGVLNTALPIPGHVMTVRADADADGDDSGEFLITQTDVEIVVPLRTGNDSDARVDATVVAHPAAVTHRMLASARMTRVLGLQSAIVVGPSGEEIHTDSKGRVRLQFHWDRYGNHDENSSCFVRVAQSWASHLRGSQFLPRVGDEVAVSFINGNPDEPIVVGSLYNEETDPPFPLPDERFVSGWRSRSRSGDAAKHNAITFDDRQGAEVLGLHAELDHRITVERDEQRDVGRDDAANIGQDKHQDVGRHYVLTAGETIELTTGQSSLKMAADGTISLTGVAITVEGSSSVEVLGTSITASANADMTLESKQKTLTTTQFELNADTQVVIKGGVVNIN